MIAHHIISKTYRGALNDDMTQRQVTQFARVVDTFDRLQAEAE